MLQQCYKILSIVDTNQMQTQLLEIRGSFSVDCKNVAFLRKPKFCVLSSEYQQIFCLA